MTRAYSLDSAARVSALTYLGILFTVLLAIPVFGERPSLAQIAGRARGHRRGAAARALGAGPLPAPISFRLTLHKEMGMAGQGSSGNVIAALASFFIPGLGQLIQGRPLKGAIMFVLAGCPVADLDGVDHPPLVDPGCGVVQARGERGLSP